MTKKLFEVIGFYYTGVALQHLLDSGRAGRKSDGTAELYSYPDEWDIYFASGCWNPDIAVLHCERRWGESDRDVWRVVQDLKPWVEPPTIHRVSENEENHLMMLDRGEPMLPGFERTDQ